MLRFILAIAFLCLLGQGCAQQKSAPASDAISLAPEEDALVTAINIRLANDPVTSKLKLGVQTADGIVTLSGIINNSAVRMRAISVVRGTTGVRGVIDKTFQY